MQQTTTSGHDIRQTANSHDAPSATRVLSAGPSTITPTMLTDREGAALWGVSLRTFLKLQHEPWFPAPRALGERLKKHVRAELEAAQANMPRAKRAPEPAQLAAGKASAKRTGQA